jgi:hypothetical protein
VTTLLLTPSQRALPDGLTKDAWRAAVDRAAHAWSYPEVACTDLELRVAEPLTLRVAEQDGRSMLVFRDGEWCHNERCSAKTVFPPRTMAMTGTYPEGARGNAVVEADVELNASRFVFTLDDTLNTTGPKPAVPLHAVLLHELGHVAGLEDVCGADDARHAPSSVGCPAANDSVMFAPALRLALSPRDSSELCRIHPRPAAVAPAEAVEQPVKAGTLGTASALAPWFGAGIALCVAAALWWFAKLRRVR